MARSLGDRLSTYIALYNLAQVVLSRGDYHGAVNLFEEGVALSEQVGDRANLAYCLEGLAVVAGARGEAERSGRLIGAAEGCAKPSARRVTSITSPTAHSTSARSPLCARRWESRRSRRR